MENVYAKVILKKIIDEVERDFNLPPNSIKIEKIRRRIKRNNLTPTSRGPPSPLAPIEKLLVDMLIQRAATNQPLNASDGFRLVKFLIIGTKHEDEIENFHRNKSALEGTGNSSFISKKY